MPSKRSRDNPRSVKNEFDLPFSSDSVSTSTSGFSIASANSLLSPIGSAKSQLSSNWLPSIGSLAAWMTKSGIEFGSSGSENHVYFTQEMKTMTFLLVLCQTNIWSNSQAFWLTIQWCFNFLLRGLISICQSSTVLNRLTYITTLLQLLAFTWIIGCMNCNEWHWIWLFCNCKMIFATWKKKMHETFWKTDKLFWYNPINQE